VTGFGRRHSTDAATGTEGRCSKAVTRAVKIRLNSVDSSVSLKQTLLVPCHLGVSYARIWRGNLSSDITLMRQRTIIATMLLAAVLLATGGLSTSADERRDKHSRVSHDEVLAALQRNEIRPLPEILAAAAKVVSGPVVKVEVKRKNDRLLYEIKIIGEQGRVREVYVDAASLDIVKVE